MTLSSPAYVEMPDLKQSLANFAWGKEVFETLEKHRSGKLKAVLLKMSGHANLAYALGTGEWVLRLLDGVEASRTALDYIEAVWAAMIDRRYLAKKQIDHVDYIWTDSSKDVVTFVSNLLSFAYFDCKNVTPDRAGDIAQLTAVTRHVLRDTKQFDSWSTQALTRLLELYPQSGVLGPAVPREVLETSGEFDTDKATEYLDAFLKSLSPSDNEFLADSQALASLTDFQGTPYKSVG